MFCRSTWHFAWILLAGLPSFTIRAEERVKAAEPAGKVIRQSWDAAYLEGAKAGYVHTLVREIDQDGRKLLRSTVVMELTLKRFDDTIRARMERGTVETPEGKVTGVSMRQTLGKGQDLVLTGTVEGNRLHVQVSGRSQLDKKIRWNDAVVGLYREQLLFKEHKVKPGDRFSYQQYEPGFNTVLTIQVNVGDYETVPVYGTKKKLLRVEAIADKIEGVRLPAVTYWLDQELMPVRSQTEMEGLGKLEFVQTTKDFATAPAAAARLSDIGLTQMLRLNRRISQPHDTSSIVYRISLPKDDEPGTAFARDARQEVKNVVSHTFELHVKAVREPEATDKPAGQAPKEFLASNFFINSADSEVRKLARRAVGKETNPWRKAKLIERWVHNNMRSLNFTEAMATADQVARTLEGDCTEYAMLAAAMCRVVQVPSRTALGLVYAELRQGPVFAYHMWTEVWIDGQWLALDATLGRGSIGAAHIKITDHSWHDIHDLKPLLPIRRVIQSKPSIQIMRVDEDD